jgi:hypothetical protein
MTRVLGSGFGGQSLGSPQLHISGGHLWSPWERGFATRLFHLEHPQRIDIRYRRFENFHAIAYWIAGGLKIDGHPNTAH